jgi:outer membrane protein OmpA-like peptidoglycan-associated protein
VSSYDRDRVRPPSSSSATPARQSDASGGHPLAAGVRKKMEAGFGHDFAAVRVHADDESAAKARQMGAQAFTVGTDVHFAAGHYRPQSEQGRSLLAHELAHVAQQAQGGAGTQPEQQVDAAAARVMQGETVSPGLLGGAPRSVQMKPDDPASASAEEKPAADPGTWSKNLDEFAHNSPALTGEHRKDIDALAAEIAARVGLVAGAKATITISGNTDTSGDERYNEGLGLKRANAAKVALEAALRKKKVGGERIAGIGTESAGEKRLAKDTPDDTKEPLNRRVEIMVKIEGPGPAMSTARAVPSPEAESEEKKPIDLNLPPDYKLPEEEWWERTERERKKIEEYDRAHPRKPKSVTDMLVEGVTKALEPVIEKLPKSMRAKARDAIRKGIEAGTEKGCEAAIDASGATGEEAEALKAACKAALKAKPGEKK